MGNNRTIPGYWTQKLPRMMNAELIVVITGIT